MTAILRRRLHRPVIVAGVVLASVAGLGAANWPDWRGPDRTGSSTQTGLPSSWSPSGENLAWRAPYGGRSTPVVFGDRLYLQNTAGAGELEQERVMCFNADTGRLLWEHKFNLFASDVPPHRIGWASPAVDPETGTVYALGGGGYLLALSPQGKVLWERSLSEEFGMWTTHGGRTSSPIVDRDRVIVSGLTYLWGEYAGGAHRYFSIDKRTGRTMWVSAPEGRPTDTIYPSAIVEEVNGMRLFFSGGSDGAMHAIKVNTGEPVWNLLVSKRGLNTAALLVLGRIIVTHSEENYETSEMGMVAAVDAGSQGTLKLEQAAWITRGIQSGYSSPVFDGERLYVVDNGANLFALDAKTGKQLWLQNLGTIQKSSPVLADGKMYVGTENGKFFIIRPGPTGAQILDEDWLGSAEKPEAIIGSPAVARGRVYIASMEALYAIGPKGAPKQSSSSPATGGSNGGPAQAAGGAPAKILVTPTELLLEPGESVQLTAKLYDERGSFLRDEPAPAWELAGLKGTLDKGRFTPDAAAGMQAGVVKATVAGQTGASRIRVVTGIPWTFDFEQAEAVPPHWINATGKFAVRPLDSSKVLVKLADNPFAFARRCRPFFGHTDLHDYTVEADIRSAERRRQMADVGIVAQRYELVLFGSHQRLELQSWQPETRRTVRTTFPWQKDTWYRMKLRVENLPDGKVRARGKVWPAGQPEPEAWLIERVDPIGNRSGSPGLYADAAAEIYYDNIRVYPNGEQTKP
jgi:outer membrane protein assembly factor BamB